MEEDKINDMTYIWFNLVLEALGKRINYDSISNILGNAFAKDAGKLVQAAHPLLKSGGGSSNIMALGGKIKIIDAAHDKEAGVQAAQEKLGDLSWAGDLFGGGKPPM